MNKHTNCADRCQFQEHKGYDTCQRQGACSLLETEDCTYCGETYPAPGGLHHDENECVANIDAARTEGEKGEGK